MRRALDEFRIAPVKTTIPVPQEILANPDFLCGKLDTGGFERVW